MTIAHDKQRQHICNLIRQSKLVAIIRQAKQNHVASVVQCLVKGGVNILEITSNTPGFTAEITKARSLYPQTLIGAGTIINETLAMEAIAAGAQFLVTPNTHEKVVKIAHASGIPVLMGALTPTEIANAKHFGADFIKVFPAGIMGTKYIKDLAGPFDSTEFIAVGGVNSENIKHWLAAGAIGVGVGNDLTQRVKTEKEKSELIEHAKNYVRKLS